VQPSRILLVDGYPDAREMWAFYLRTRGFDVRSAADGMSAVRMASEWHPDLIVMDLVLPVLNGCEAARRLRASPSTANIPVLATTGDTHPEHLDEARSIGFVRIMIKPCDPPRLVNEIHVALAARAAADGHEMRPGA
jgi:CheY-like chemotaxis protein